MISPKTLFFKNIFLHFKASNLQTNWRKIVGVNMKHVRKGVKDLVGLIPKNWLR